MSIDTETLDLSFTKINKYFNKKITQEIVNGIVEFTNIYVETNESQFHNLNHPCYTRRPN